MVRAALIEDKSLLQFWSLRGAPHVVPAEDARVFTTVSNGTTTIRTALIQGARDHVALFGMTTREAVTRTAEALPEALSGQALTKGRTRRRDRRAIDVGHRDWTARDGLATTPTARARCGSPVRRRLSGTSASCHRKRGAR